MLGFTGVRVTNTGGVRVGVTVGGRVAGIVPIGSICKVAVAVGPRVGSLVETNPCVGGANIANSVDGDTHAIADIRMKHTIKPISTDDFFTEFSFVLSTLDFAKLMSRFRLLKLYFFSP